MNKAKARHKTGSSSFMTRCILFSLVKLSALPLPIMNFCAKCLGALLLVLRPKKRKIAYLNIQKCFPRLKTPKVNAMVRASFYHYCLGILWSFKVLKTPAALGDKTRRSKDKNPKKYVRNIIWQGEKKVEEIVSSSRRVILLGGHFAFMDTMGWGVGHRFPSLVCTYKKTGNAIFDRLIQNRSKYMKAVIEAADVHRIRRVFSGGDMMWLTIDQDSVGSPSIYANFFGVPASSPIAGWRWAKIMDAEAFILHAVFLSNYSLKIYFHHLPGFKDLPAQKAIELQNDALAEHIKKSPSQYIWMYKRFRRRPAGEASVY